MTHRGSWSKALFVPTLPTELSGVYSEKTFFFISHPTSPDSKPQPFKSHEVHQTAVETGTVMLIQHVQVGQHFGCPITLLDISSPAV